MIDWQNIAVAVTVLIATIYIARRAASRLRSFFKIGDRGFSCASACGRCDAGIEVKPTRPQATVFVQIGNARSKAGGGVAATLPHRGSKG